MRARANAKLVEGERYLLGSTLYGAQYREDEEGQEAVGGRGEEAAEHDDADEAHDQPGARLGQENKPIWYMAGERGPSGWLAESPAEAQPEAWSVAERGASGEAS